MGKTVSIYLNDQYIERLSQYKNSSQIIKKALDIFFKTEQRQEGFDKVLQSARQIGDTCKFDYAVKEWQLERDSNRW